MVGRLRSGAPFWLAAMLLVSATSVAGCHRATSAVGNVDAGAVVITRQACGSCHRIPGIAGADGDVGPPLAHFAGRKMIAGKLDNVPANLERYLVSPQAVVPGNVMPDQHLTEEEVRDVAAYLESLR